ncbi:hypothetical protein CW304_28745 [Bacillus sp. UFRGS-B20]|nr:hypothetical protein CW304_28745 [Bacillus sp. UFRGS-B20]
MVRVTIPYLTPTLYNIFVHLFKHQYDIAPGSKRCWRKNPIPFNPYTYHDRVSLIPLLQRFLIGSSIIT